MIFQSKQNPLIFQKVDWIVLDCAVSYVPANTV